jgi:type IV pilus assembly protein PilM
MAGKVVSIKIGYTITHVAEVDHEVKTPRVYHAFSFETPDGVLDDEGVHISSDFVTRMKQGMVNAGIDNKRAVFTISSTRVANREVTIPLVKENKIRPLLTANAKEYFPVDMSKYQLVYRVIEQMKEQKQMKLSVFAVPNSLVNSYQLLAKSMDMQLEALDYFGNSIHEAMINSMEPGLAATLCVDDNYSMLTVVQNGQVILQRSIGYGVDDAIYALMQTPLVPKNCGYEKALVQMQVNSCFAEQLHSERDDEEGNSKNSKDKIAQSLTLLIGNVSRVLDYFSSRHSNVTLESLTLVGMGASCRGLDVLLSNELGIPVRPIRNFGKMDVTRALSAQRFNLGEYYINIGASIKPLNFVLQEEEKKKREGDSLVLPAIVCGGCILISVAILISGSISNLSLRLDNKNLESTINSKQSVIDDYNEYLKNRVINEGMVAIESTSNVPNDAFLDFLDEMETKMPSDLLLTNLSVSEDTVSFSATCSSEESAAETLIQLRTFDTTYQVQSSGITVQEDEDTGSKKVSLDVSMTYMPTVTQEPTTDDVQAESAD